MHPRRRGHVETLVVAGRRRRCGIGSRLLASASEWARAHGAAEMVLTAWAGNAAADAFYERHGYRVLSRVLHAPL
jgi:ribosomal protein S18 acetylase RimI-like enzyme